LAKSDVTLLFSYFFLFCLSKINLGFLISVFFNSSKLAAVAGPAILFSFILPRYIFFGTSTNDDSTAKIISSILSPTAFTFGADILADYEFGGYGVQYFNMYDGEYNFGTCLKMMLLDALLYGLIAWYLDKVLSKEYGIPRHPLFFLLPSYWNSFSIFKSQGNSNIDPFSRDIELSPVLQSKAHVNIPYESVPEENNVGGKNVVITELHKVYDNGKIAVKSLNLTLVANQITCLLGANGAGKSTTMSILTGMTQPTSGDINIFGKDMNNQLDEIRQMIGICPQQNVHFDMLTVEEHVKFFALLKGIESGQVLNEAVDTIIDDVGLTEKKFTPSKNLSGGMKRKLSLAMALIGDSKLILLDEPTSGLDPYARKAVWELLKKHKKEKDRVIVLSTHYMWEADNLADRIAILSEGSLVALASPKYLKSELGLGYVLSLSKSFPHTPEKDIDTFVYDFFPNGRSAAKSAGREMSFFLPFEDVPKFGDFFTKLEVSSKELEIDSYGISLTSLEQIFIKIAQNAAEKEDNIELVAIDITNKDLSDKVDNLIGVKEYMSNEVVVNKEEREEYRGKVEEAILIEGSSPVKIYSPVVNVDYHKDIKGGIELNDLNNKYYPNNKVDDENFIHNVDKNLTFIDDENESNNNIYDEYIWLIQLRMLLYKRYLNCLRDVSGFFFQIVVPAMQIFLVLSILMISFNPAGRTLKMNTSIYFPYVGHIDVISFDGTYSMNDTNTIVNTTVINDNITEVNATTPQPSYFSTLSKYLSKENMNIEIYDSLETPLNSSNSMSEYLLDTFETVRPDRYGVFIANDAIKLYLTVLWKE
jgi:ABC-type multidrug transport system ATPase subunit